MEIQFGPNSVDEPNLLYKLQRKLKVFNTTNDLPKRGYNLVASSSKYGLVFITTPEGMLCVYYLKQLIDKDCEPQHLTIPLPIHPTHLAVNCNQEWLAVVSGPVLLVYKCLDFQNQDVRPSVTMQLQVNPSAFVSSLQWNPCVADTIGIVFFDGTLLVSQVSSMQVKKIQSTARCLCWSPKGKQLVTGNSDGTLSQYKPDLSPMKMIPTPNLFEGSPVEALAIYWISTYQFAVSYRNASNNSRPAVTIVNTPKGGTPSCFNYEDICYSTGSSRPWYYYLIGIGQWNLILAASSNSMEIATLASADGADWRQWCQSDEARPELPLTDRKQENYPVGVCIDTAAVHQLPWGENEVLQPMPLVLVVSQTGLLSMFNVINLNKQSATLCAPPQLLSLPEAALSRDIPGVVPTPPPTASIQHPKPHAQQAPQQLQPQVQPAPQQQLQPVQVQPPLPQQPPQQTVQPQPPKTIQPQLLPQIQQTIIVPKPQQPALATSTRGTGVSTVIKSTIPITSEAEKSVSHIQPQTQVPKPQPHLVPSAAESAAIRHEQERISRDKAEQELTQMLIKEFNDFQMELYGFMKSTRETQQKFDRDLHSADLHLTVDPDPEQLKKECEMEELRESIPLLKVELVRAYGMAAEAIANARACEMRDWRQADPLTSKRLASINKMIYYVQSQLDQSRKALHFRWNDVSRDRLTEPGERMVRPILDDVYRPLVKQQEILCRQRAVLHTLRAALEQCDLAPGTKATALLRTTPFRNKDPLSKLTKNILNMSIEPQTRPKSRLSSQKLDALKDLLSNRKPIKIKPVNVELRQHLETLKKRYEKNLKKKNEIKEIEKIEVKTEMPRPQKMQDSVIPKPKSPTVTMTDPRSALGHTAGKPRDEPRNVDFKKETNIFGGNTFSFLKPSSTESPKAVAVKNPAVSVSSLSAADVAKRTEQRVVRTLFTDEPKEEKPFSLQQTQPLHASVNTKSLLIKLIEKNSSPENTVQSTMSEHKDGANTFKGQKICSPTAFGLSVAAPSAALMSVVNKVRLSPTEASNETGEREARATSTDEIGTSTTCSGKTPSRDIHSVPDVVTGPRKAEEEQTQMIQHKPVATKKVDLKPSAAPSRDPREQTDISVDVKKPAGEGKIEKSVAVRISEAGSPPAVPSAPTNTATDTSMISSDEGQYKPSSLTASVPIKPLQNEANKETEDSGSTKPSDLSKSKSDAAAVPVLAATPATAATTTTSAAAILSTPPNVTAPFGFKPTTAASIVNTASTPSSFGEQPSAIAPNTATSVFATASAAAFGSQAPTLGTTQSVFGTTATATTTITTTSTTVTATTTSHSIFGSAPAAAATSSIFGSAAQSLFSAAASKSLFGATPPSTATTFGASIPSTSQSAAFGSTPSAFTSSQGSVFGTAPATQAPVFGTSTAQTTVFGSSATQGSVFGGSAPAPSAVFCSTATSQAAVFGAPTITTTATTTTTTVTTTSTTTQGSLFGGAEANLFAAANISTTSAPSQTSGGSIFGGSSGSVFNNNTTNVFGGKSSFGTSAFGQKSAADFWSGAEKSSGFGTSTFGQSQSSPSSSVFGSGSFSAPSAGGPFGAETPSVFSSPPQQTAPAFGASPAFGSKPVFGGSPSFGAPSFGSGFNKSPSSGFGAPASFGGGGFGTAAFGNASPSKVFGNSSPGFGSPSQQSNSTFENLATQNTLTFGNLAQQSGQPATQPPSFNTSPSFTGWRG